MLPDSKLINFTSRKVDVAINIAQSHTVTRQLESL